VVIGGGPDIQYAGAGTRLQAVHEYLENIFPHTDKKAVNVSFQTEREVVIISCHLAPLPVHAACYDAALMSANHN
jgi:hypothetical protein